jgi:hypothetical protein
VRVEGLPVESRVSKCRDIEFAAAHQTQHQQGKEFEGYNYLLAILDGGQMGRFQKAEGHAPNTHQILAGLYMEPGITVENNHRFNGHHL